MVRSKRASAHARPLHEPVHSGCSIREEGRVGRGGWLSDAYPDPEDPTGKPASRRRRSQHQHPSTYPLKPEGSSILTDITCMQ